MEYALFAATMFAWLMVNGNPQQLSLRDPPEDGWVSHKRLLADIYEECAALAESAGRLARTDPEFKKTEVAKVKAIQAAIRTARDAGVPQDKIDEIKNVLPPRLRFHFR